MCSRDNVVCVHDDETGLVTRLDVDLGNGSMRYIHVNEEGKRVMNEVYVDGVLFRRPLFSA